jgi:Flp pilus assembly protein TadG
MLISRSAYRSRRRSGNLTALAAILMVPLVGVLAIVLDGGCLYATRRQAQTAADAAALAAAVDLYNYYPTNHGYDKSGTAAHSALTTAKANGYNNDGKTNSVIVNINTTSSSNVTYLQGQFKGKKLPQNYVEVVITVNQPRFFSAIWGSGSFQVPGHAVARAKYASASPGILILDPKDSNSLDTTAAGGIFVTGGGSIVVDSNSSSGASITNSGNVEAQNFYFSGNPGYSTSNTGKFIAGTGGSINTNAPPTPDPLATMPEPSQPAAAPAMQVFNGNTLVATVGAGQSYNGNNMNISYDANNGVKISGLSANQSVVLQPGYYGGINISAGGGNVTLADSGGGQPGLYYIGSQGLSTTNGTNISGSNVLLYSAGTGNISLTGKGNLTLSAPTSGPYAGMALWQERSSNKQISITSYGTMSVQGAIYAAAAKVAITAQGGLDGGGMPLDTIGSQFISYQLNVTGSGSFKVDYTGASSNVRQIQLVE